jgi:3-phosphoshikimate 1-carboxyvinyltransferase
MKYIVKPGGLIRGEVKVPGDKSISHRSLMLGGIAEGITQIDGFLESEDCLATLGALQKLGVRIERPAPHRVIVHGVGVNGLEAPDSPLDMGNAGTAMRLFMGLLSAQRFNSTLVGDASLSRRPMERVAVPLRSMGADITTHNDCPPVEIRGGANLRAIKYELPVASAQVKSALLLAGLYASGRTRVVEPAITRDHTERMLRAFGVEVLRSKKAIALEGGQALQGTDIDVPGDFSSAAFFMVAGCLAADSGLILRGVGMNPTRTGLLDLLRRMGADIRVHKRPEAGTVSATGTRRAVILEAGPSTEATSSITAAEPVADVEVRASRLKGIKVPESLVPLAIDELPVFFVAAACAQGETLVRGALELRVKESDRLAVMAEGLAKLGVKLELLPDGIWIKGGNGFTGGQVDSHGDHRAAMSFAVAAVRAQDPIEISDVANVATSFPGFVEAATGVGIGVAVK